MTEITAYIDEVNALIKDDEWFNIPMPVRSTCEGIIKFNERLASKILFNAETGQKKF